MKRQNRSKLISLILVLLVIIPVVISVLDTWNPLMGIEKWIQMWGAYFGALIGIVGVFKIMQIYINHEEALKKADTVKRARAYFQFEKVKSSAKLKDITRRNNSKLIITENYKKYTEETDLMFFKISFVSEAPIVFNINIEIQYKDMGLIDTINFAALDNQTDLFIPLRFTNDHLQTIKLVDMKMLTISYKTIENEEMKLVYDKDYKKIEHLAKDESSNWINIQTEYIDSTVFQTIN